MEQYNSTTSRRFFFNGTAGNIYSVMLTEHYVGPFPKRRTITVCSICDNYGIHMGTGVAIMHPNEEWFPWSLEGEDIAFRRALKNAKFLKEVMTEAWLAFKRATGRLKKKPKPPEEPIVAPPAPIAATVTEDMTNAMLTRLFQNM